MPEILNYETEKLTFAAYLVASDKARLVGTKPKPNSKMVIFILNPAPDNDAITEFFNGSAMVSALRYSESLHTLKSLIIEEIHRNDNY